MNPRIKPIAAALALLGALEAIAQTPELSPVVVTATRQASRVSDVLADITVIEREELASAGHANIIELLARQPGVEMAANGGPGSTSTIYLRGGANGGHTLVLIDGQRVGSATLGSFNWSRMSLDQIERIEILRGAASSLYGSDAIGGVVQIFTRRGDGPARFNGEVSTGRYNTRTVAAGVSGASNGWRYALQGSQFNTDGYNLVTRPASARYGDNDSFVNKSFSAALAYAFSPDHELSLNTFNSEGKNQHDSLFDNTLAAASRDYRNHARIHSHQLMSSNRMTSHWTSTLKIGQSIDDSISLTNGIQTSKYKTIQDQAVWQNDLKTALGNFLLGIERLEQKISTSTAYSKDKRSNDSVVLGWSGNLRNHHWQTNLRHDDNSQFGGKNTGALSYGFQFMPQWRLSAAYGTAFKAPSMNDLYYPLDAFGYVGNPNLKPENSENRELGLAYRAAGHTLSLTSFSNNITNLISWSGRTSPVNVGKAKVSGETLSYSGNVGGFDLLASYTLQKAIDAETGRRLARRAKNYGSLGVARSIGPWELRTEVQGAGQRYDTDANTRSLGGYFLVNLSASYALDRSWSVFGRIDNALNKKYELAGDYARPGASAFLGLRYSPK